MPWHWEPMKDVISCDKPVSYTHLDVYKRQVLGRMCDKLEFLLFYDTFNIAVINISLCNRIEKWLSLIHI